ncbi:SRPBCC family protein [Nocardioides ungokensis]|uniref:SRPBCC family protein n=1 Tax=Nocardioides ungokensis TaxID=1643322 RepID=UPI001C60F0D9
MTHVRGHIDIAASVETVFDVVADQTNEPTYNPGMVSSEMVTPAPLGEGSRFRAVARSAGREVPMTIELVEYGRPHHLGSSPRWTAPSSTGRWTSHPTRAAPG